MLRRYFYVRTMTMMKMIMILQDANFDLGKKKRGIIEQLKCCLCDNVQMYKEAKRRCVEWVTNYTHDIQFMIMQYLQPTTCWLHNEVRNEFNCSVKDINTLRL